MSDDKSPGVDPRFDPAFQRGFDGTVSTSAPPARPRKSALAKTAAPEQVTVPERATTAPELGPTPPVTDDSKNRPSVPVGSEGPPASKLSVPDPVEGPPTEDPHSDSAPSRNPYLLFLGIIAIALFATGIWLFVRSGNEFNSKVVQSQGDYMSLTATIYAAPFIAMLGAMTAIGVLFVFALRWRGRKPR